VPLNYNWGCGYANGIVFLAKVLDLFRLGSVVAGGRMIPSGSLSFVKRTCGCLGVEPRRVSITLAENLHDGDSYQPKS
jgi:hypothetical protein